MTINLQLKTEMIFTMKEQIESRLAELRSEFEQGQKMLAEVESRRESLRQSLLRISGAIQVLEELLKEEEGIEAV
jgi:DNA repair exonuclease SbcCD ATPase subunit